MMFFHGPILLSFLTFISCYSANHLPYNKNQELNDLAQKQTLRKQMAKMLDIDPDKLSSTQQPKTRSSNAAARYMQKLYFKHSQNPGPYEGSTVRSISPRLIESELENVDDMSQLIFNLGAIHSNERILRAEIHFNQRIHRSSIVNVPLAEFYKAKAWCTTCNPTTMLQLDRVPSNNRQWATFIATDLVDDIVSNNKTQLKVQFTRRDTPILAPKSLKIHSPFLLIFTQQPVETTQHQNQNGRRKRSLDSYYQYMPVEDSNENEQKSGTSNSDRDSDAVWQSNFEKFRQTGPRLLKERVQKKARRSRYDPNDPMMGFGKEDESDRNRINKKSQLQEAHDELTVYLLGSEQEKQSDKKRCAKREFVVNFRDIGWNDWIIAPKKFEAGYCAGSCEFPLVQGTNPSNHAQLQSIAHSLGLLPPSANVCCAPDRLDSQTLLYYDESGNVVLKNYPKMVVSSCSCV